MKRSCFVMTAAAASLFPFALTGTVRAQEPGLHVYGPGGPAPAMRDVVLAFQSRYGTRVSLVAGPTAEWRTQALQDADIIYSGSENMMTDFVTQLPGLIAEPSIVPAYIRSAAILVHPGNPRNIRGLRDLFKPGIRVMIVQGAGQTGMWEDLAGRGPHALEHLRALRTNIVSFAANSAQALATWTGENPPEAWIIYNIWQISHPSVATIVPIEPEFALYRDAGIALTTRATSIALAKEFYDFVLSKVGAAIFAKWGWSS